MDMREFSDSDRNKKIRRIVLPDNPGNLSNEQLDRLEDAIRLNLKDGYVACLLAWRIADELGVSRLAVGAMVDKLGVRITDCQLGCFKVAKASKRESTGTLSDEAATRRIKALDADEMLTCSALHEIAHEIKVIPLSLAHEANAHGCKIRQCQLGCF